MPATPVWEYSAGKTLDGEPAGTANRRARRGVVGLLHAAADPRSEETAPVTSEKPGCSDGFQTSTRCACTIHRKAHRCVGLRALRTSAWARMSMCPQRQTLRRKLTSVGRTGARYASDARGGVPGTVWPLSSF